MNQTVYRAENQEIIEYLRQRHTHDVGMCNKEFAERFISDQEFRELMKDAKQKRILFTELRTHPDLGERFYLISKDTPDATRGSFFGYDVLINKRAVIFAVAVSMNTIMFRLSPDDYILAMELGGETIDGLSQEWVSIDAWGSNLPTKKVVGDLQYWCNQSLTYVNGLVEENN